MTKLTKTPQWKSGQSVEQFLDAYFRHFDWEIERTTPHQERVMCLGDRIFKKADTTFFVEYKSGIQTKYTGNIFIETVSVDTTNTPGWLYTCRADFIFYACLLNRKILAFVPDKLRSKMALYGSRFPIRKTTKGQNETYNTHGFVVPLAFAEEQLAVWTVRLAA